MQAFDKEIEKIAQYAHSSEPFSEQVKQQAGYALMDAMSCALLALHHADCLQHIRPLCQQFGQQQTPSKNAMLIPGTACRLDVFQASYVFGVLIRWLDYNDTWLAREWGHPSDNLGALLPALIYADSNQSNAAHTYTVDDLLDAMIRAYEIQGVLALDNSFNEAGYDHVILLRLASSAVAAKLMGGDLQQVQNAISNALLDGVPLRTYRHAPNTGWRKSWAAAKACRESMQHAFHAIHNEMGYAGALSADIWGFDHVVLKDKALQSHQNYADYVMQNILYKIAYPIEFHAQTAVECALLLHDTFVKIYHKDIDKIESIVIDTHQAAMRIINKTGPLLNPADRDHCIQYGVAVALLEGKLNSDMFTDDYAANPQIDKLREKMIIEEDMEFTELYHDPQKRAIANRVRIQYLDTQMGTKEVLYPLGHKARRDQGLPLLRQKFETSVYTHFNSTQAQHIVSTFSDFDTLRQMPIQQWLELWQEDSCLA